MMQDTKDEVQGTIRALTVEFSNNMHALDFDTGETNLRSINTHLDYLQEQK